MLEPNKSCVWRLTWKGVYTALRYECIGVSAILIFQAPPLILNCTRLTLNSKLPEVDQAYGRLTDLKARMYCMQVMHEFRHRAPYAWQLRVHAPNGFLITNARNPEGCWSCAEAASALRREIENYRCLKLKSNWMPCKYEIPMPGCRNGAVAANLH